MVPFPDESKEFHIKGAGITGMDVFAIKMASGFYNNKTNYSLPNGNGMVMLFSADTGFPLAFLQDGGYLTDLRTSGAAATMANLLQVKNEEGIVLGVVGNGIIACACVEMYKELVGAGKASKIAKIVLWARREEACTQFQADLSSM